MRVWRICRERFANDALAGRGGIIASGRWHTRGRPVVYASESLALAALEVFVHVEKSTIPADLMQLEIDIPDDLEVRRIDINELPRDWRTYPAPSVLQRKGDEWLAGCSTPILQVPSSVIVEESNFLMNPQHALAHMITIVSTRKFIFDSRLMS